MIYCINRIKKESIKGQRTAGKKAPDDIARIVKDKFGGMVLPFFEPERSHNVFFQLIEAYILNNKGWKNVIKNLKKGDFLIIQHPYEGVKQSVKWIERCIDVGINVIVFVHDISVERFSIDKKENHILENIQKTAEIKILKMANYVVCHNNKMKKYLVDLGVDETAIYCLEVFDYLCDGNEKKRNFTDKTICIAGNLSKSKSGYVYNLPPLSNYKYILYGPNYLDNNSEKIIYMGVKDPNELPREMEGLFGLVWDGNDINACSGTAGEYLKINNPHKCSLYLAANMPIIIWSGAALAGFVKSNGVGFCVDNLYEINNKVNNLDKQSYEELLTNVRVVGNSIRNGEHFSSVLMRIISIN